MSEKLSTEQKRVLKKARDTYGARGQLAVVAEECCELSIAVLKFMRYYDEKTGLEKTREKVLEERADVEVVLNHIDEIYGFTDKEICKAMEGKIDRLERWLDKTDSMEYTMIDREVKPKEEKEKDCSDCFYFSHFDEAVEVCKDCVDKKLRTCEE